MADLAAIMLVRLAGGQSSSMAARLAVGAATRSRAVGLRAHGTDARRRVHAPRLSDPGHREDARLPGADAARVPERSPARWLPALRSEPAACAGSDRRLRAVAA